MSCSNCENCAPGRMLFERPFTPGALATKRWIEQTLSALKGPDPMPDPAPPLTEAELLDMATELDDWAQTVSAQRFRRAVAMARRALTLESELAQLRQENEELHSVACDDAKLLEPARQEFNELVELRREKAEREGLERRRDAWLRARQLRAVIHHVSPEFDGDGRQLGEHHGVVLSTDMELSGATAGGTGPTYEAALAAALAKVEKA